MTNTSKRTIIVGDLHGCYDEAIELLDKAQVTSDDRVIFVGDLVDRGPASRGCVELAMRHECVLGNHEDMHLTYFKNIPRALRMPPHHAQTRAQLETRHWRYISTLPLWIRLPEHNVIVVHAGVWPHVPFENQDRGHLLHLQCLGENKRSLWPSKAAMCTFWSNYYNGRERIVFGHTGLNKPLHTQFVTGIDTGCVFGRELTAYILPDDRFVQVKARECYHTSSQRSDWKTVVPIHGDVHTYS